MKTQFDKDLDNLKHMLIDMSMRVDKLVELTNRALFENNLSYISEINQLEDKINFMEVDIDNYCVALIARHQPTATDLRFILSVSKMSNHLERVADLGINVTKKIEYIMQGPISKYRENLRKISILSQQMVQEAMAAFIEHNAEKARAVCIKDDEVDNLHKSNFRLFIDEILKSEIDPESGIDMLLISKYYESIADQATNLGEEVIYYIQGKNIKHHLKTHNSESTV